ncbi:hypothetical protein K437DRAFT_259220 [Tilletiaria anomala UBC 951]|uniref:SET domain-containing protein n=1 Tax=Tilletiaria anomala (strain ATCC 24038 / CBS 436.72 / UBC 951) TaxID=1037660 RepID=A0A066VFD7_TILAU|nr:uncharacterized protein K437DRAFT_259220 [Tilletiaria anomala UBC 951]KDN39018.1 hypothetical protein K437DRAFT_259220 [Tilletiaria anomala UBC 951]
MATAATSPSSTAAYAGHMSNGEPTALSQSYVPTHPGLFYVQFQPGSYNSSLTALRDFAKGETIASMDAARESKLIRYSTVQVAEDRHVELNSDLLYCNHSCDPTVVFDVSSGGPNPSDWKAKAWKNIKKGDTLTFFYPSTEWSMSQPFVCNCSSAQCLGTISGAACLPAELLLGDEPRYWVNAHIRKLKEAQLKQQQQAQQ